MTSVVRNRYEHKSCWIGLLAITAAPLMMTMVAVVVGCGDEHPGGQHSPLDMVARRSFHAKANWKADKFFDDALVIQLCHAIENNDLAEMERLIELGADVNARGEGNMTPLLWAFPDGKLERFKKLLDHGADPNVRLTSHVGVPSGFMIGDSVTTLSSCTHFPGYYEAVMQAGGDANLHDGFGKSVLHVIILGAVPDAKHRSEIALQRGADINETYGDMSPAVAAAMTFSQFDLALYFLEQGADPSVTLTNGVQRLVHCVLMKASDLPRMSPASRAAHQRLLDWLAAHGEDIDTASADLKRWEKFPLWNTQETAALWRAEREKYQAAQ